MAKQALVFDITSTSFWVNKGITNTKDNTSLPPFSIIRHAELSCFWCIYRVHRLDYQRPLGTLHTLIREVNHATELNRPQTNQTLCRLSDPPTPSTACCDVTRRDESINAVFKLRVCCQLYFDLCVPLPRALESKTEGVAF